MDTKTFSRRIDSNGKLTIPDEFKKALNIIEGTKLDLTVIDDSQILVTKSKDIEMLSDYLTPIASVISETIEHDCLITNLDTVIASNKKKYMSKTLTSTAQDLIQTKEITIKKSTEESHIVEIIEDFGNIYNCELIVPIISNENAVGSIIILSEKDDAIFEDSIKATLSFSKYIANKIM